MNRGGPSGQGKSGGTAAKPPQFGGRVNLDILEPSLLRAGMVYVDGTRVSTKRTGSPCAAPAAAKSRITVRPRRMAATGQPLVFMPSNGVQPQREAIQALVISRVRPRSTM